MRFNCPFFQVNLSQSVALQFFSLLVSIFTFSNLEESDYHWRVDKGTIQ